MKASPFSATSMSLLLQLLSATTPTAAYDETCRTVEINFQGNLGDGTPFQSGDLLKDLGGGISVLGQKRDSTLRNRAMIFDTAVATGGDTDLATRDIGNVLIVSQDLNSASPNDRWKGGIVTFTFEDPPEFIRAIEFLDVDDDLRGDSTLEVIYSDGTVLGPILIPLRPDGALQTVRLDQDLDSLPSEDTVAQVRVRFAGSGAISKLSFCTGQPPPHCFPPVGMTKCFQINHSELTAADHQEVAEMQGCQLASILNQEEKAALESLIAGSSETYWLGGVQRPDPGVDTWYWEDHEAWCYTNWLSFQPPEDIWANKRQLQVEESLGHYQWMYQMDPSTQMKAILKCESCA